MGINQVVVKPYADTVLSSISYMLTDGVLAGRQLTGGHPEVVQDTPVVCFAEHYNGQRICVSYANRADLAALVDEYNAIRAAASAKACAKHDAEQAADRLLLDKMEADAAELRKRIPADHVSVTVRQTGDMDGDPILEYTAPDGTVLRWDQVTMHGTAYAIRNGALGPFAAVRIASISRADLAAIKAAQESKAMAAAEAKASRAARLRNTPIPPAALDAYRMYHGDSEAAWAAEDEGAWALIERWTPYIEAQHGTDPHRAARLIKDAARENDYGIND